MIEPISDETVHSWKEHFARMRKEIYPKIFEPQGFTLYEAEMLWCLNALREDVANITRDDPNTPDWEK